MSLFGDKVVIDRDAYRAALKSNFTFFANAAVRLMNPGIQIQSSPHYAVIDDWLMYFNSGRAQKERPQIHGLAINVPPRTMKSLRLDAFACYRLINDPTSKTLHICYGEELTLEQSTAKRHFVKSKWSRRNFPEIQIAEGGDLKKRFDLTAGGMCMGSTVLGPITGFGGTCIILDDLLKAEDAYSEFARTRVNRWYENTLISRFNDASGFFVAIGQRLHPEDFFGYIKKIEPKNWIHLVFPLICEKDTVYELTFSGTTWTRPKGDILLPGLFTSHKIERLRKLSSFEGQYMQRPSSPEGTMLPIAKISYYDPAASPTFDLEIISVDCSYKSGPNSDFVSILHAGIIPPQKIITDKRTARLDVAGTIQEINSMIDRHPNTSLVLVEEAANGRAVIESLQGQGRVPVLAVKPMGGKDSRAAAAGNDMSAGQIVLPIPDKASWDVREFVELLASYNGEGSVAHDDDIDSFSQLCAHVRPYCASREFTTGFFDLVMQRSGKAPTVPDHGLEANLCPGCGKPLVHMSGIYSCINKECGKIQRMTVTGGGRMTTQVGF